MLDIEDEEFSEFSKLLERLDVKIKKNEQEHVTKQVLATIDLLVIGNPINDFFSSIEIKIIVDFVRSGGSLLLLSEYGSDFLQKTNLNDISGKFGIFFEKNIVKEENSVNQNCTSILHIHEFSNHKMMKQIREINIGGTCSLTLNKEAKSLVQTLEKSFWSEVYNKSSENWVKDDEKLQIISAYAEFGKGKVVALGDIDIFTSNSKIGIKSLDNRKFLQNLINWLIEPVEASKVISFMLNQLGDLHHEIKEVNKITNNIIETMTILEKRISNLEENTIGHSPSLQPEKVFEIKSLQEDKL